MIGLASVLALATASYGDDSVIASVKAKSAPQKKDPNQLSARQRKRQEKLARRAKRAETEGALHIPMCICCNASKAISLKLGGDGRLCHGCNLSLSML